MSIEQQIGEDSEANERDRLGNINQQLAETEQALRRTLEFFDRIEGSEIAYRLGASDIRLRLLTDLEKLEEERDQADSAGK